MKIALSSTDDTIVLEVSRHLAMVIRAGRIDFETVRKIGLRLPGVEEITAYGSPALKIRGKLLACVPTHRAAEPVSLVVRVGFELGVAHKFVSRARRRSLAIAEPPQAHLSTAAEGGRNPPRHPTPLKSS